MWVKEKPKSFNNKTCLIIKLEYIDIKYIDILYIYKYIHIYK